ncbi:MAG: metalloregulator ArsR/SmtB family transcription factor [Actinomycetota bacterium]|nr:metalloregulator ArsR/SmtB family transcription factor [Actinomycetota bacterium]
MDERHYLFKGLADRSRLSILEHLRSRPSRVSDVVDATGLTQPNVSAHLSCLWDCGLVARERKGREVHYRLIDGVEELLAAADAVVAVAGITIGACPNFGSASEQRTG